MNDIVKLATRMKELQTEKEAMDERWKFLTETIDDLRLKQIPEAMAEQDIRSMTIEGVGRVQLALDVYASIKDKAAGYEWLREHGYDGLLTEYVQPSTFKAAVKDALKKGQKFPEELFNITPFTRASIVKA